MHSFEVHWGSLKFIEFHRSSSKFMEVHHGEVWWIPKNYVIHSYEVHQGSPRFTEVHQGSPKVHQRFTEVHRSSLKFTTVNSGESRKTRLCIVLKFTEVHWGSLRFTEVHQGSLKFIKVGLFVCFILGFRSLELKIETAITLLFFIRLSSNFEGMIFATFYNGFSSF